MLASEVKLAAVKLPILVTVPFTLKLAPAVILPNILKLALP